MTIRHFKQGQHMVMGEGSSMRMKTTVGLVLKEDLPIYREDFQRTAVTSNEGPTSLPTLDQEIETGSPNTISSLTLYDNRLFFVTGADYASSSIIDESLLWTKASTDGGNFPEAASILDDVVYIADSRDRLYALNTEDGSEVWNFRSGSNFGDFSSPAVDGQRVYTHIDDGPGGNSFSYAVDIQTGVQEWSYDWGGSQFPGLPVLGGDNVYGSGDNGAIVGLDRATGNEEWRLNFDDTASLAIVYDSVRDQVILPIRDIVPGTRDDIIAIDGATGAVNWDEGTFAFSRIQRPSLYNDMYIFPYEVTGEVVALSAIDGSELWRNNIGVNGDNAEMMVGSGRIYISGGGDLWCIDPSDGSTIWGPLSPPAATSFNSQITLADGNLLVTNNTENALLYS